MMRKFKTPQYQDTFRYNWAFEKYNTKEHFWLEVDYFINRDEFVTRKSLPLNIDLKAENGRKIFRNMNAQLTALVVSRNYKLLEETVAPANADEDILKVTELYGYAPDSTFIDYENQIVKRCGVSDPSGYKKIAMGKGCSYDASDGTMKLDLTSADYANQFSVGDIVYVDRPATSTFNSMTSEETPVTEIDGKYVCVKNFTYILNYNGSTYTGKGAANALNELVSTYIIRNVSTRQPQNRNVLIKSKISFVESVPETISQKFTPVDGAGSEVDIINTATIPNIEIWKKIVAGTATRSEMSGLNGIIEGGYMQIEDAAYENFHGIYKKTLKYTKCI